MSVYTRESLFFRPASVPIHDGGHVKWKLSPIDAREQIGGFHLGSDVEGRRAPGHGLANLAATQGAAYLSALPPNQLLAQSIGVKAPARS